MVERESLVEKGTFEQRLKGDEETGMWLFGGLGRGRLSGLSGAHLMCLWKGKGMGKGMAEAK